LVVSVDAIWRPRFDVRWRGSVVELLGAVNVVLLVGSLCWSSCWS
jgi:hypothetical protein